MKTTNTTSASIVTYVFETHAAAWDFSRACEAAGIAAGWPELTKVQVARGDRARAERLADTFKTFVGTVWYPRNP